ncbi:MAG: 1-acyl-sn-glycerol-3-phosphate acyltransferase [Bacteriovoracaceae bacterium]|nr:1-acyl-sn-glycerol-3-phosphate acyltransferase [Bacteriovoracaceae bacterium]
MFYLHALLFSCWIILTFPVALVAVLIRPFHVHHCRRILRPLCRVAAKAWGLKIKLDDPHNLFESAPHVIVSNHQASLDLLVGGFVAPWRAVSIGKRSLVWIPLVGPVYWLCGNILINRQNPRQAIALLDRIGNMLNRHQRSVWVMPEGTRNQGRGLLPFKKGPCKMAVEHHVDVVPVAISPYAKLNFHRWHAGTIQVKVLPAISTQHLVPSSATINQVRDQAFTAIQNACF